MNDFRDQMQCIWQNVVQHYAHSIVAVNHKMMNPLKMANGNVPQIHISTQMAINNRKVAKQYSSQETSCMQSDNRFSVGSHRLLDSAENKGHIFHTMWLFSWGQFVAKFL